MIDFEERVMRNHQQKQRDDILREAIKASCDKNGKPDEHLIINYRAYRICTLTWDELI